MEKDNQLTTCRLQNMLENARIMTERNQHTAAITEIAIYTRNEKLVCALNNLNHLHNFYGYLTKQLGEIRDDLKKKAFAGLTDEEAKLFRSAI